MVNEGSSHSGSFGLYSFRIGFQLMVMIILLGGKSFHFVSQLVDAVLLVLNLVIKVKQIVNLLGKVSDAIREVMRHKIVNRFLGRR
jgi:galactitol-specific phosphotransferase system IIC component